MGVVVVVVVVEVMVVDMVVVVVVVMVVDMVVVVVMVVDMVVVVVIVVDMVVVVMVAVEVVVVMVEVVVVVMVAVEVVVVMVAVEVVVVMVVVAVEEAVAGDMADAVVGVGDLGKRFLVSSRITLSKTKRRVVIQFPSIIFLRRTLGARAFLAVDNYGHERLGPKLVRGSAWPPASRGHSQSCWLPRARNLWHPGYLPWGIIEN